METMLLKQVWFLQRIQFNLEDKDSPYANIIAVRAGEENEEKFKKLMKALQSEKVKKIY